MTIRAMMMAPRTPLTYSTMARTRPNRNRRMAGSENEASAGVPPLNATKPTCTIPR